MGGVGMGEVWHYRGGEVVVCECRERYLGDGLACDEIM